MQPFQSLSERGQARRLRRMAFQTLQTYDLDVDRVRLITNNLNAIFRLDSHHGEKYILRITKPETGHTPDHVAAETDWLTALARDTEVNAPRPQPARNGALFVEAATLGVPEARMCAVFSWLPGTNLAEHISSATLSQLGELMARLHLHALTYQPPAGLDLLRYEQVFHFPEPVILFEERFSSIIPIERSAIFRQALDWAQNAIERLKASGEAMRILHGDLHQWNVRYYRGRLSPFDFEDLMWGWPAQDIATTLYYFQDRTDYAELRAAFQQGYQRLIPWPERYPGEIDAFIAARGLDMFNFVLNNQIELDVSLEDFADRIERRLRKLVS